MTTSCTLSALAAAATARRLDVQAATKHADAMAADKAASLKSASTTPTSSAPPTMSHGMPSVSAGVHGALLALTLGGA